MLLGDWNDLDPGEAEAIERDHHAWAVQPKRDGVRALLHIEPHGVRLTGRNVSETTFRLSEHQDNVPHLCEGLGGLAGTVLDGELVCPAAVIDTGETRTQYALQAAVAILAAGPVKARAIQEGQQARLRFHAFDVLTFRREDAARLPLSERLVLLRQAVELAAHPYLEEVPAGVVGKPAVHQRVIESGGEGTVWKRLDRPYEPGRRVRHWLKRKRGVEIEAFVTGFKPGSPERGNAHRVGAVEFGRRDEAGRIVVAAWVSNWTDQERDAMTRIDGAGNVTLNPDYLGRKAVVAGQDVAARSQRIRHARIMRWVG